MSRLLWQQKRAGCVVDILYHLNLSSDFKISVLLLLTKHVGTGELSLCYSIYNFWVLASADPSVAPTIGALIERRNSVGDGNEKNK